HRDAEAPARRHQAAGGRSRRRARHDRPARLQGWLAPAREDAVSRSGYDGVVIAAPVTTDYVRYTTKDAHWFFGRALSALIRAAGIKKDDIDGFCVSSFTLFPDTAVGLTQHFGLSPRWLDHIPMGGACGVIALRRAARAVQAGDAEIVACVAA